MEMIEMKKTKYHKIVKVMTDMIVTSRLINWKNNILN